MRVHVASRRRGVAHHAAGELVWANVGNYIENPACRGKFRPVVILQATDCQHLIAGLTTRGVAKGTGWARPRICLGSSCLLLKESYLWSARPSWLSRLDVGAHIGWVSPEAVEAIARHMRVPAHVIFVLRQVAAGVGCDGGALPL